MEWARNYLGVIVAASDGGAWRYGMTCPSCGELVNRRAGSERRPHFAHYSNRAKPECENYFPSQGSASGSQGGSAKDRRLLEQVRTLQSGVFLARDAEGRVFQLLLRIPVFVSDATDSTAIEIRTELGARRYLASQLMQPRLVPLQPTVPAAVCIGIGPLASLAMHLNLLIADFNDGFNFFVGGDDGGRLLGCEESLEWGRTYYLLTNRQLGVPDAAAGVLGWASAGRLGSWHMYEVCLPAVIASSRSDSRWAIADFLCRQIRVGQPRAYLLHPLPHHFDMDGAYVFREWPKNLLIRTTAEAPVALDTGSRAKVGFEQRWVSEGLVRLEGLEFECDEATLTIGGRDQLLLRIEECGLLSPVGITASSDGHSWDLINCPELEECPSGEWAIVVECSSSRLADHISRRNVGWELNGATLKRLSSSPDLDAQNFGALRTIEKREMDDGTELIDQTFAARQGSRGDSAWLEWLVVQRCGGDAAKTLTSFLAQPGSSITSILAHKNVSPLLPYIFAEQIKQKR